MQVGVLVVVMMMAVLFVRSYSMYTSVFEILSICLEFVRQSTEWHGSVKRGHG